MFTAEKVKKSLFPQCKILIHNNSISIKHRAMKFLRAALVQLMVSDTQLVAKDP